MKYESKYGFFAEDGREYIITNPFTPRPWVNVISNGDYSIIVSQMGGGFSFRNNAEQNRLTRLFQDTIKDNWGKYFYIRDKKTNRYFSTSLKPMMTGYDKYEVHVGIGYTTFIRVQDGLEVKTTMFVSPDKPMEYALISIKDLSGKNRELDATSYFEWAPGIAPDNHREFHKLFTTIHFDDELNTMYVTKCLYGFADSKGRGMNDDWPHVGFLSVSEKIESYEGDKEAFLGMYHDESNAVGMDKEKLSNSKGRFGDPCGAIRCNVNLKANEEKSIVFTLGLANIDDEDFKKLVKENTNVEAARRDLEKVHVFWSNLLDKDVVKTNDDRLDFFTNIWSKYQAISCRLWAKAAYYQISGGIGYRDQLQDSLVFLQSNPELTKKQILLHAEHQFYKGDVQHWWLTIHSWGPRGNCSDDFLWLPFAVIDYVNETGDYSILDIKVRYLDHEEEPIYEHVKKAIFRSIELTSPRGVPLMGDHDWNDGLSAVGRGLIGESFWVSEFLYYILNRMDEVIDYKKDNDFKQVVHEKKELTKKTLNEYGWDGDYFLQATNDLGELIGSHTSNEGKVFLNPQIWAVIADVTTPERKEKAMEAVTKYLLRDYGALLLYPAYEHPYSEIGYVTRYAPGLRENGGVYTHAATWATWAYSLMGDNERAYQAYIRINPISRTKDPDVFKSEPYVTPGNSDGPISPYFGKGGWSWYSGSAQWMHNVAITTILGIRGNSHGIIIKPCLPKEMGGYTYDRMFNKSKLHIEVRYSDHDELIVNGKKLDGNFVPISGKEEEYKISMLIKK